MKPFITARVIAIGLASAVVLAACQSDSGESGGMAGDGGESSTFVVGLSAQPVMLVRSFVSDAPTATVALSMTEGLVRTDKNEVVVPALATDWEISDDGLTYTFVLREGVTWHDGTPFTAADVLFSFQELLPLAVTGGGAAVNAVIDSVSAPDDLTFEIKLKRPFAPLLSGLGPQNFTIQAKHLYEGTDYMENQHNRAPVGTGPYQFVSSSGDTIRLEANEDYWGGAPSIETLIFRVIPDSNSRANALKTGEIDYINKFDVDSTITRALANDDGFVVQNGRVPPTYMTMWINTREPALDDPAVRRALMTALDRDLMANSSDEVYAAPARGSFAEDNWAFHPDIDYTKKFAYDPEKANRMLDDAGYPVVDGSRFDLQFRYVGSQAYTSQVGAVVADNLKDVGVDVRLSADEREIFVDSVFANGEFGAGILSFTTDVDPEYGISRVYACNAENIAYRNPSGYCNEQLDNLFDDAAATTDEGARVELYHQAQEIIAEELPAFTLFQMDQPDIVNGSFSGVEEFLSGTDSGDVNWMALQQ